MIKYQLVAALLLALVALVSALPISSDDEAPQPPSQPDEEVDEFISHYLSSRDTERDEPSASLEKRGRLYRSSRPKIVTRKLSPLDSQRRAELSAKFVREQLQGIEPLRAGEIVKILQRIAHRKGIQTANKTLRYGISRR